jgi:hypothetical protein
LIGGAVERAAPVEEPVRHIGDQTGLGIGAIDAALERIHHALARGADKRGEQARRWPLLFTIVDIEPDVRIARIRLSDKNSRLHPRHVVPKPTAVRLSVEQIQLLSQCGNGRAGIALRKRLQNGDFLEGMDGQNL